MTEAMQTVAGEDRSEHNPPTGQVGLVRREGPRRAGSIPARHIDAPNGYRRTAYRNRDHRVLTGVTGEGGIGEASPPVRTSGAVTLPAR